MGQTMEKIKKAEKKSRKVRKVNSLIKRLSEKDVSAEGLPLNHQLIYEERDQFYDDVMKAESWMKEKIPMFENSDYGTDIDSSLSLHKDHASLMIELENFSDTIEALKFQSSHIFNFELEKQLQRSPENLELQKIISAVQFQLQAQYDNLLYLGKIRQQKLNQATRIHILVREANEHVSFIEDACNNAEKNFLNINTMMSQVEQDKFMESYSDFQSSRKSKDTRLYLIKEIIKELKQLDKKKEIEIIEIHYRSINERWSEIFKKMETTYVNELFERDVKEVSELLMNTRLKEHKIDELESDVELIKSHLREVECFENEIDVIAKKVQLINERQKKFMQTYPDIVVRTHSEMEMINSAHQILLDGTQKWKNKLNIYFNIYKCIHNCRQMMENFNPRLETDTPRRISDTINNNTDSYGLQN